MRNPLRALLQEPRPSAPPDRVWRDGALLACVLVAALLEGVFRVDLPQRGLSLAVTLGLSPLLLWRRTHPFAVVAATFGAVGVVDLLLLAAGRPTLAMNTLVYLMVLPYALVRWGSGREAAAGAAVILLPAGLSLVTDWTGVAEAVGGIALLLASCALGWAVRAQHGTRERRMEQVKAEERVLLARDLHDTVAHHVSAIAIHAQAARALAATSPSASLSALEVIETEASRTLAEMRAMVRVLRGDAPAEYAPQPGVADLDRLKVDSPSGPRVEVTVSADAATLPQAVDAAVYRIAQEAVTNARRHARNATLVDVRVSGTQSRVNLTISDDGDNATAGSRPGAGFGLAGMAERAALLGGSCQAGPSASGGWTVVADLPREVTV